MNVRTIMHTGLKTVATTATVAEAIDALVAAHVSALPVLDPHGRAVGVISGREVLEAEHRCQDTESREYLFDDTLVLEVMRSWVPTIEPDQDVRAAAQRMLTLGEQRLFVEQRGALIGVVSLTDIARAFVPTTCSCEEAV
jgi:CBS domain-containing protein